jgi:ABC-2 type transport system permease protein
MTAPDTTEVGSRQAVALVAGREITTRVHSKSFRISTVILLVGIVATVLITKATSGSSSSKEVGFLADSATSAPAFRSVAEAVGQKVKTPTVASRSEGEKLLRDGKLDALVTGTSGGVQVEAKKELNEDLRNILTVLARQTALNNELTKAGADPAAVSQSVASAKVDVHSLIAVDPDRNQRLAIGIIAGILVYLALLLYGQAVAQGVVEEKTSRIVELLLTAIRPWQLLLGKVIGIGVLGLAQLLGVGVLGVVTGLATNVLTLPGSAAVGALVTAVGWFLLGYLMYALLFAGLGALVSRQEDVGGAVAPLTMLIVVPYILGISILPTNPDSPLIEVLSLIPPFSPTLMPMRVAGGVPGWQMGLAVVLSLATIAGLVWLAGRIYGNAVTRTGARVRLRDALRPI